MTQVDLKKYEQIADILYYPRTTFKKKVIEVQEFLDKAYPNAGQELRLFSDFVDQSSQNEIEELYTRSFEVQAITAMDLGYMLFGDDYKRAKLLVSLNREVIDAGIDTHNELADHLPNVLKLLPKLDDETILLDLILDVIYPSLEQILSDFNPEKIKMKTKIYKKHHKTIIEKSEKHALIYEKPLRALMKLLEADYNELIQVRKSVNGDYQEQTKDFLSSVANEMDIEDTPIK
jgi:nitrate reductase assembly molybdenum cofactor insertion protein NarJ